MNVSLSRPVALIVLASLYACGEGSLDSHGVVDQILPPITEADRIEARRPASLQPFLEITEPSTIQALRQFVNAYPAGWTVPFAGPPVGQVYFDFYAEDRMVGNFYVGPHFFGRDHGGFFSRTATDDEIERLNSIVGFMVIE